MRLIVLLAALFALAGCASGMSKDECLYADWRAIGYEDGAAGRSATAVSPRRVACAKKAGVTPDMEAYLAGRDDGLEQFCRPANGFDIGARGVRYAGVCQGSSEGAFVAAYEKGLTLHGLISNFEAASQALSRAHADLDSVEHQIAHAQAAIVNPTTPNPERIDHLAEMKTLYARRDTIRDAIPQLARDVEYAEDELEDFRRNVQGLEYARATRALNASY